MCVVWVLNVLGYQKSYLHLLLRTLAETYSTKHPTLPFSNYLIFYLLFFFFCFLRSHPFLMIHVTSVSQVQGLFHPTWKGVIEQRLICSYYVTTFLILLVHFKIYEPSDLQIKTFIGMYYCVVERIRSNSEILKVVEYV